MSRSKTGSCDGSSEDFDDKTVRTAVRRFSFTSIRTEATEPACLFSFAVPQTVSCRSSASFSPAVEPHFELTFTPPFFVAAWSEREQVAAGHRPNLGWRSGYTTSDGVRQVQDTRRSCDAFVSKHLAAAQQYLQALRECDSPPAELREGWEAFYRACDPLVRRTVAACSLHRADEDDCVQEAWAEIVAKLTRFEYAPNRGPFQAWLRIVVHRAACRHARRDYRQTAGRIDEDLSGVKCPRMLGPAMTTQREELRASVRKSLDAFRISVSSTAFRILIMTTIHGQTSTEIGQLLGLTPGHVRLLRHRTAQRFRQYVAAQPDLAESFGISEPANSPVQTSGSQRTGELRKSLENF